MELGLFVKRKKKMPKFVLTCEEEVEHGYPARKNTVEFFAVTYDEVIDEMTDFLRGSGYQFEGHLEMVDKEEPNTSDLNKRFNYGTFKYSYS